jgi:hypothetical protein
MLKYPNYENSILSLINSIEKYFGVVNDHSTLEIVDTILEKKYRNVVVMVFDAMGSRNLQDILSEDSFLRKHMLKEICSVFPPTTTAATTTLESGLAPSEHSWLGWSLHFPEVNDNVNIFINTNDIGKTVADYHVANKYIPYKNVVNKINEASNARAESISQFGTYHVETFEEIIESIETLCHEDGRHYLYTYWNEPDTSMHLYGVTSAEAVSWVERINVEIERLSSKLQETVLFIIADHGHINGKNKFIGDYPDILDTLKWLPSIEPRAIAFYVKEGREVEFQHTFLKHFKEDFMLLSKQDVITKKLFGPGKEHPRFKEFLGDYLAVAISDVSIFNSTEEVEKFIGAHAGLTEAEMMIPLIVVERK